MKRLISWLQLAVVVVLLALGQIIESFLALMLFLFTNINEIKEEIRRMRNEEEK